MSEISQELLDELAELVAIPSVSADAGHAGDVLAAAEWVRSAIERAGGTAEVLDWKGKPLTIGEVRASHDPERAPTVICYAHFDVQPPDPLELWTTPPFELTRRDGWLYARGVADDKGHLVALISAAGNLAAAGELPVNVRFAFDSEEETGGTSIVEWAQQDDRGADAVLVLDGGMTVEDVPEINVGLRGLCYFHLTMRTGERDLHSGIYGGAALNALHALQRALAAVVAGPDGRVPEPLRAGIAAPTAAELAGWSELPSGREMLEAQGARPMDGRAAEDFYVRTWAEPSVEVHGIEGGSPRLQKTVLPVEAQANLSIRLAPGQDPDEIAPALEGLLREATPEGAELTIEHWSSGRPAAFSPDTPAIRFASEAIESVAGRRPLLVRTGGTIPVVAAFAARGIPVVVTGFAQLNSNVHSPDERMPERYVGIALDAVTEIYRRFAALA